MRVGVISVFMDHERRGRKRIGVIQPGVGIVIASLLPRTIEIDVVNETVEDPDWNRGYDLLYLSCLHPDLDRARQISHYWRRRGAKTVLGGPMASNYPGLCKPFFDAIAIGDAEGVALEIFNDFSAGRLKPFYVSRRFDPGSLPPPRFDLFADKLIAPLSLEATRGCPFSCDFCALTGLGTRYHTRPPELVVRDIRTGQETLREKGARRYKSRFVSFLDNNIGGNPAYLRSLAEALTPLEIKWSSAITFNALRQPGVVGEIGRSGCIGVFVGLETFNPNALASMNKFQNALDETRTLIDDCLSHGITFNAGLILSPEFDNWEYIQSVPERLRECGLHLPVFITFEAPIPGTPFFNRLAADAKPRFLPNALLRDFAGNTLVVEPTVGSVQEHIEGYRWLLDNTYTEGGRFRKALGNTPRLLASGAWGAALANLYWCFFVDRKYDPTRTYVAGTDRPPPEAGNVPLKDEDFVSDEEREAIVTPWRVTDENGRALPQWTKPTRVFERGGGVLEEQIEATLLQSNAP